MMQGWLPEGNGGMPDNLADWIGRSETASDTATRAPLDGLAAMLDHASPPWPDGEAPPLGHWLYFLPRTLRREIAEDGHARKGGFLPPVSLPRRMWAGGDITFHAPLRVGSALTRTSTIVSVTQKQGRSGALAFVTLRHELSSDGGACITETQDIVYREAASPTVATAKPDERPAAFSLVVEPDPVLLFRFSALTFNSHRIHYDRGYSHDVEGYEGLVIHGPLIATCLVDLFLRHHPSARVGHFVFRALRPLFDTRPFKLCGRSTSRSAELWALTPDGHTAMSATLELR